MEGKRALLRVKRLRWLMWGILCSAYIIGFVHRMALGTVKDDLVVAFHLNATAFANLSSAYFYAYLIMQIPTGMLLDTVGAKRIVVAGSALAGIGSVMFGLSPTAFTAFISRMMVGVGASVIYIAILKILTEWFYEREFATLSGMTTFIGNLGGIVSQTPLFLLVTWLSWRSTFMAIGALGLLAAGLCLALVKDRPSELGLPSPEEPREQDRVDKKPSVFLALKAICRNPRSWPPFFFFAAFYGTFQALAGTWGQSYLVKVYKMSGVDAGNRMIVAVVGVALGSVAVGKFSDRLGRRRLPMSLIACVNLATWAVWVFCNSGKPPVTWLPALLFITGFSTAAYIACWACGKEVNDPRYAGLSIAFINSGGFLGAAFIPVMLGKVIDLYGKTLPVQQLYQRAFLVCFICSAVGWGISLMVKETKCKSIWDGSLR